jgi:hypothetical protein
MLPMTLIEEMFEQVIGILLEAKDMYIQAYGPICGEAVDTDILIGNLMISNSMYMEAKEFYANALKVISQSVDGVLNVRNGYVLSALARVMSLDPSGTPLALRLNEEALTALRWQYIDILDISKTYMYTCLHIYIYIYVIHVYIFYTPLLGPNYPRTIRP